MSNKSRLGKAIAKELAKDTYDYLLLRYLLAHVIIRRYQTRQLRFMLRVLKLIGKKRSGQAININKDL